MYLLLKSKNVVKFLVHISPIFSCQVTNCNWVFSPSYTIYALQFGNVHNCF